MSAVRPYISVYTCCISNSYTCSFSFMMATKYFISSYRKSFEYPTQFSNRKPFTTTVQRRRQCFIYQRYHSLTSSFCPYFISLNACMCVYMWARESTWAAIITVIYAALSTSSLRSLLGTFHYSPLLTHSCLVPLLLLPTFPLTSLHFHTRAGDVDAPVVPMPPPIHTRSLFLPPTLTFTHTYISTYTFR